MIMTLGILIQMLLIINIVEVWYVMQCKFVSLPHSHNNCDLAAIHSSHRDVNINIKENGNGNGSNGSNGDHDEIGELTTLHLMSLGSIGSMNSAHAIEGSDDQLQQ